MKAIYLDYAAATPLEPAVLAAMQPFFSERFYNPSASYLAGHDVSQSIRQARAGVASWLGARPSEIVFTAGGTEANNLAINGVMQAHPGANVVISAVEHESVIKPAGQYQHKTAKVLPDGVIDVQDLQKLIDDKTVLVSVMYANNEIGTIEPLRQVGQILAKIKQKRAADGNTTPLYFHTDACQAAAYLDLHAGRLGVDLMSINGGKIYGPKQSGALYIKTGTKLRAQILGGGQESGARSGTENVAFIIGLAKALDLVQSRRKVETVRLQQLQKLFIKLLSTPSAKFTVNGSRQHRLPGNVHITIPGTDNERLMMQLDERGIMCAVGSACSATSEEPSHVLQAIGLSDKDARSSLRFSMGHQTTEAEIRRSAETILTCI